MLRESATIARETGTWWQTHVSEDPGEIAEVGQVQQMAPLGVHRGEAQQDQMAWAKARRAASAFQTG